MDLLRKNVDFSLELDTGSIKDDKSKGKFTEFETHENNYDAPQLSDIVDANYFEHVVPTHLLMVSLLEHICSLYEDDEARRNLLFQALSRQMVKMKLMPSFPIMNDFKALRRKYQNALAEWMKIAIGGMDNQRTLGYALRNKMTTFQRSSHAPGSYDISTSHISSSRYKNEFDELEEIGRGGFGSVFKVQNNLDRKTYAIKKIRLSGEDYMECLRVLREVKVLAKLNHQNVVRYYSAWLEHSLHSTHKNQTQEEKVHAHGLLDSLAYKSSNDSSSDSGSISFRDSSQENRMNNRSLNLEDVELSDPFLRPGDLEATDPSLRMNSLSGTGDFFKRQVSYLRHSGEVVPYCSGFQGKQLQRSLSSDNIKRSNSRLDPRYVGTNLAHRSVVSKDSSSLGLKELGITMFIQMEVCPSTLKDWIDDRNNSISEGGSVDWDTNIRIFKQLLHGVQYIHKSGLIHRDLKPRNIFVNSPKDSRDVEVKIGDFGLARDIARSAEDQLPRTPDWSDMRLFSSIDDHSVPTSGVGTCTYAAPEQLNNSHYSTKVDIYSLGIILFELFHPFQTQMERAIALKALREGKLPKEFQADWPAESQMVEKMISENPFLRPTTEELLHEPILFDKDMVIAKLRNELAKKDAEIARLRSERNKGSVKHL